VLLAVRDRIVAAGTAATTVDIDRTESDPYTEADLPAINLLAVEEAIQPLTPVNLASGGAVLQNRLQLVVQVVAGGGAAGVVGAQARLLSAQVAAALGADPTLAGLCVQGLLPAGKQWLHDEDGSSRLIRQNNLWVCTYRTTSVNPFSTI
jgi:hypothetical protein